MLDRAGSALYAQERAAGACLAPPSSSNGSIVSCNTSCRVNAALELAAAAAAAAGWTTSRLASSSSSVKV